MSIRSLACIYLIVKQHCLVVKGVLRAFRGQLIHILNKREGALSHAAGLRELQGRPNVLLLGDSLGDLTMADGVSEPEYILTIGFLNDQVRLVQCGPGISFISMYGFKKLIVCLVFQVEERKESYINSFDIVLVKDETMDVPNAILTHITSSRDNK